MQFRFAANDLSCALPVFAIMWLAADAAQNEATTGLAAEQVMLIDRAEAQK
jgi:hypothetical protein